MGRLIIFFFTLFGIGILAIGASSAAANASGSGDRTHPPGKPITPGAIPPDPPVGVKAITVPAPLIAGEPARLTADAVRAYFATSRHTDNVGDAATVEAVEIMTAGELTGQLRGISSLESDRLVCVVTLRGKFHVSGPPHLRGWDGTTGYAIFDALTGNSLIEAVAP